MNELDIIARKYGTDKRTNDPETDPIYHGYVEIYHELFKNERNNFKYILEIGVREGWSHQMWYEYFSNSMIYGIDNFSDMIYEKINFKKEQIENDRIKIFIGDQSDEFFLKKIFDGIIFDCIIDDGSHCSWHQQKSFKYLFPQLKQGGYYIIEDLGVCIERREFTDIRSSTIFWLESIKQKNPFSYYIDDNSYINEIEFIEIIGELGIIKKR